MPTRLIQRAMLGAPGNYLNPASPIVGIVGDTPDAGLDNPPIPTVFMPMRVAPWWPVFTYVIRTSGATEALAPAVRRELRAAFPVVAIRNVQTMIVRTKSSGMASVVSGGCPLIALNRMLRNAAIVGDCRVFTSA